MNTESPDWIDARHDLYVMLGTSSAATSWPAFRRYIDSSRRGREQSRISCSLLQPNGLSSLLVV